MPVNSTAQCFEIVGRPFTFAELEQRLFKRTSTRGRVSINTSDTHGRKQGLQFFFNLLGALTDVVNKLSVAARTFRRRGFPMIAIVADDHAVVTVISQRHVTIGTLHSFTARSAKHKTRVATTVQENDRLLTFAMRLFNGPQQVARKDLRLFVLRKNVPHVHDFCRGKRSIAQAVR